MMISNPNLRQILLEFQSELEREEFELWLRKAGTLNWTTLSNPLPEEPLLPTKHLTPTDQKLANLEKQREGEQRERWQREQREKKSREGVLPWWERPR